MKLMGTFGSVFALAILVAAFAHGAALASSTGSSHYTQQGLKADGLRLQAMAQRYTSLQNQPAASFYTRAALNAMGLRWLAIARSYTRPHVSPAPAGGGFDWANAGIGVAAGSALALCLVVFFAIRRRPRETNAAA